MGWLILIYMHVYKYWRREMFVLKMDTFLYLYSFLFLVLIISTQSLIAADHKIADESMKDGSVIGMVGAIVDNSSRAGKEEELAMKMAIEDFHSDHYSSTNQTLILHVINSDGDPMQAVFAARDLISKQQAKAILGPQTWEETSLVAKVGSENNVPVLSFAESTPKWANEIWPYLAQASHDQTNQMKAIAAIVQSWKWFRVNVIYEDKDSLANEFLPQFSLALREVNAEIAHLLPLPPCPSSSLLSRELENLKKDQTRVFVVHLSSSKLGVQLFQKAKEMNMMEKDYVWITTDPLTSLVHSFNSSIISSMQGVLGVKRYFPEDSNRFREFRYRFRKRFDTEHPEEDNNEPGIFAVQAYDAAWTVALAMKENSKLNNGQKLLEKILKSDFRGLSGKVEFNSDQRLPPADIFQIINVAGKSSYIEHGFWSEKSGFSMSLGENDKKSSSMEDLGLVIWPGFPRNTPRGWTPPTASKPLRIGVPGHSMFKQYVNVEPDGSNLSFRGFSKDVFQAMLDELPYHLPYEFNLFNDTYDKLVEQIHLKKFDAVVGDVAIVSHRYEHAEFTQPYTDPGLVMVVPVQPEASDKTWLFMKPFTKSMWVLIVLVNLYNGFVVWFIERNNFPELKGSMIDQIGTLIWVAFSTLFSLQGDKLHSNLSKMTMVVWLFVALVITQTYTANLSSMLTVTRLEPTVADIETLQSSNSMVGYCRGSYLARYLIEALRFKPNNIKNFTSPEDYARALRSREIGAAFLEVPAANLFLAKYCKGFIMVGPTYKVGGYGYAFPRGSPMLPSINEALLKVSESGKIRELENIMLASEECEEMDEEDDDQTKGRSLSPNSFWVLFIITGTTSTIAFVCYLFRVYKSLFKHKTFLWRLMAAIMKYWGDRKNRFSRRISDVEVSGTNSLNVSDSPTLV